MPKVKEKIKEVVFEELDFIMKYSQMLYTLAREYDNLGDRDSKILIITELEKFTDILNNITCRGIRKVMNLAMEIYLHRNTEEYLELSLLMKNIQEERKK